ncbi:MAG TPA: CocE/NonD family hydrolase, partial [Candidatus Thermoplasmatota archaeon]|nr:CocE/NonD family hydrolase [Candidatus Thermoplasmatota archaeon]
MRQRGLLLVTLLALIAAPLAGCIQADPGTLEGATTRTDEDFRLGLPYDVSDTWSHPLVNGTLKGLPVEVLELPSHDGTILRVGVYRPDVPEGTKVPVIIDAGPYYGRGEGVVESSTDDRLANFLIENFVPHGYAVVLAAIRGTGNSGGCIELMSEAEQKDMDFLTTTFGEMEWSNGAVAYIGKSYDGTTPWMAAQYGNPYLKTIVPMQGLSSIRDLMFRNGTSETRGPIMHNGVYWPFGFASEGRST